MVRPEDIKQWVEQGLPDAKADVVGDGQHFEAVIVAAAFAGKSTLQRHRMVYAALGDKMHTAIHALSLRTLTPDEHQTRNR